MVNRVICKWMDCDDDVGMDGYLCQYHQQGGMLGSGESYERYQIIEKDFIDFIRVVPLVDDHFDVYSPVLGDIIIRACVQVEIFFKEWGKWESMRAPNFPLLHKKYKNGKLKSPKDWKINDFHFFYPVLSDLHSSIHVMPLDKDIYPFEDWDINTAPFWWSNYNSIKHDGHKKKKNANYKTALYALAGLFKLHCTNRYSSWYLSKFNFSYVQEEGHRVRLRTNDITTPIDSKKYLFKANHSSSKRTIDLATISEVQDMIKNIGRTRI